MRLQTIIRRAAALLLAALPIAAAAQTTIHVGYFPNVTHAQALVGHANGQFQKDLGAAATLDWHQFNAGPAVIEALYAGAIDIAYIGPSPTISGYVKSDGAALRVIAGASSGAASLVVRNGANINTINDFHGKTIATPQLGNTQDVALREWLAGHGFKTIDKGGDVRVQPTDNPERPARRCLGSRALGHAAGAQRRRPHLPRRARSLAEPPVRGRTCDRQHEVSAGTP